MRVAQAEQRKEWPEKSKVNKNMFKFDGWIYKPPERCAVRGLLDTGADVSWISIGALRRANLTTGIKRVANLQQFKGFDGTLVRAIGEITIQWWYTDVAGITQTEFFVIEDFPGDELDMIVGIEDIVKHELVSVTRALMRCNKPEKIEEATEKAKNFHAANEVLAKDLRQQESKELARKQEELRGGSSAAEPSSSASSTNAAKPHPLPPPRVPPKSASVS
ncbi:hypothetical protein KCU83_g8187, partial [Aureobasidium melanogenum]